MTITIGLVDKLSPHLDSRAKLVSDKATYTIVHVDVILDNVALEGNSLRLSDLKSRNIAKSQSWLAVLVSTLLR